MSQARSDSARADAPARTAADLPLPGGSFTLFVQKLAYQALITLGVVENPLTRAREPNLPHAQSVIDDLMMLRDKTRGNLAPDEEQHLARVVGDLQRHFVQLKQQGRG
ncbi:MAG: DUF1844 domain-containing protein [Planctomycetes bacterium]|nr:DUF1844 domain-containing protein [Planctomycetota bacterium]